MSRDRTDDTYLALSQIHNTINERRIIEKTSKHTSEMTVTATQFEFVPQFHSYISAVHILITLMR